MTLTKTKPRRPTTEHKKRHGLHHHQGHHYLKTYWPYLPIVAILTVGLAANSWLDSLHRNVLGYATDMSVSTLLNDTNNQRASNNLGIVTLNGMLSAAAQAKANDMAARDYWSHNTPDGKSPWSFILAAGYTYQTAGENLAYGFTSADDTVTGWMNSPEHRANILNVTYRDVGFGVINIPNYQSSGPETLVVAMYGSVFATAPAPVAAPAKPIVAVQSKPVQQPSPVPPPAPAISAAPTKNDTLIPAATAKSSLANLPAPEPVSQNIARFQLVSDNTAVNYFVIGMIGVACFALLLMRHSLAWHRRLVRGERFILRHPAFDVAAVVVVSLSIILGHTAGLIK